MAIRIIQTIVFTLLIGATFSCNKIGAKSTGKTETISDIKFRLAENNAPDPATPLDTAISYNLKKQAGLGQPASFICSNDANLFLVDNQTSSIFKVSSDFQTFEEFIKKDGNKDSLEFPFQIKEFSNNLYINDNEGLKVFSKEGQFQKAIKSYIGIGDFTVLKNDEYLVTEHISQGKNNAPLILKLDLNGKKTDSIGQIKTSENIGLENQIFLERTETQIVVAYKYLPLIEIYDLPKKNLISSFKVQASIFDELIKLKENKEIINPEPGRYNLPSFIGGIKLYNNKLYVLLNLPFPEIIEFNFKGEEIGRYRSSEIKTENYFGFDIREVNNTTQFVVGHWNVSHIPFISVYAKPNK